MFKYKSLFARFLTATMLIALLISIQGVVTYFFFTKNDQLKDQITNAYELQSFLIEAEVDHHLWVIQLYDLFAGGPIPENINNHTECNLGKWYYSIKPESFYQVYYDRLEEPHKKLHQSSAEVLQLYKSGDHDGAIRLFRQETLLAVNQVKENLQQIKQMTKNHVTNLEEKMAGLDQQFNRVIWIALVSCFIIAIGISTILTRIITKPVGKIVKVAELVASGDLTQKAEVLGQDELARLAMAFNKMVDKLRGMVVNIQSESQRVVETSTLLKSSSDETNKAVEEIANTMTQIADGNEDTTHQVIILEDISKELSKEGLDLVENVTSTFEVSKDSEEAALKGQQAILRATEQLNKVTQTVNDATGAIEKLDERSGQIGEMVKLIDGLASQTNLLALNAAIEASRAGDSGQGFAVVAEEVRQLAVGSADAAKKITSLIADIKSETSTAVTSMTANLKEVDKQVVIIREAGDSLTDIVSMSKKTRELVEAIKKFSMQLQETTQKMGSSIGSIAGDVEENAASSEEVSAFAEELSASVQEVAASADELDNMSQMLEVLIKEFKI